MLGLSETETKVVVMEDDAIEIDLDDDCHISSDDADDSKSDTDTEKDTKQTVKKVADVMNKILSAEQKGPIILSKAKRKLVKLHTHDQDDKKLRELKAEKHATKTARRNMGRSLPEDTDFVKEKKLRIIATQGVVQLFSTFQKYNTELSDELGDAKTISQRERVVSKKQIDFMKILDKEGNKIRDVNVKEDTNAQLKTEEDPQWNVFAGDFYKEPTLKGWDKKESDED